MDALASEKLQTLDGSRSGSKAGAAVRRRDLASIVKLGKLSSQQVTGAPTAADYNKLQADVAALFVALGIIANKVKA